MITHGAAGFKSSNVLPLTAKISDITLEYLQWLLPITTYFHGRKTQSTGTRYHGIVQKQRQRMNLPALRRDRINRASKGPPFPLKCPMHRPQAFAVVKWTVDTITRMLTHPLSHYHPLTPIDLVVVSCAALPWTRVILLSVALLWVLSITLLLASIT